MPERSEPCWMCSATARVYRLDCPECVRRWEDAECRALRERLFPVLALEALPD